MVLKEASRLTWIISGKERDVFTETWGLLGGTVGVAEPLINVPAQRPLG